MRCKICGNKTDWDSSFGHEKFIICPQCYHRLNPTRDWKIHVTLCRIGVLITEKKKENKNEKSNQAF